MVIRGIHGGYISGKSDLSGIREKDHGFHPESRVVNEERR